MHLAGVKRRRSLAAFAGSGYSQGMAKYAWVLLLAMDWLAGCSKQQFAYSLMVGSQSETYDGVIVGQTVASDSDDIASFPTVFVPPEDADYTCSVYVDGRLHGTYDTAVETPLLFVNGSELTVKAKSREGLYVYLVRYTISPDEGTTAQTCLYKNHVKESDAEVTIDIGDMQWDGCCAFSKATGV